MIDQINPFQAAFEILSKSVTAGVLKTIQEAIEATRIVMTSEEVVMLWPKIKDFTRVHGHPPSHQATDALEARMGEALIYIRNQRRQQGV